MPCGYCTGKSTKLETYLCASCKLPQERCDECEARNFVECRRCYGKVSGDSKEIASVDGGDAGHLILGRSAAAAAASEWSCDEPDSGGAADDGAEASPALTLVDGVAWCRSPAELRLPICWTEGRGTHRVTLGHSFAELAARERYLRGVSGIAVRRDKPDGPNNALAELRLLFTNAAGESRQVVVHLVDRAGRLLLFRSTAAHVLAIEGGASVVRTHDVLGRGTTTAVVRGADGELSLVTEESAVREATYAHVGSLSFYTNRAASSHVAHRATPEDYARHHREVYLPELGLSSSASSAQLQNHSEQAIYKLLWEHPDLLVLAVRRAASILRSEGSTFLREQGVVSLRAVALDVFTTRAACRLCQRAGRAQHERFFRRALERLRVLQGPRPQKGSDGRRSTTIRFAVGQEIAWVDLDRVQTFVRFACAFEFGGTPESERLGVGASRVDGGLSLHALPTHDVAIEGLECDRGFVVSIPVEANDPVCMPLLKTGLERPKLDERTATRLRALRAKWELGDGRMSSAEMVRFVHETLDSPSVMAFFSNALAVYVFFERRADFFGRFEFLVRFALPFVEQHGARWIEKGRPLYAALLVFCLRHSRDLLDGDRDALRLGTRPGLESTPVFGLIERHLLGRISWWRDGRPRVFSVTSGPGGPHRVESNALDDLLRELPGSTPFEESAAAARELGEDLNRYCDVVLLLRNATGLARLKHEVVELGTGEIAELLEKHTAEDENRARNLAHELGLVAVYDALFRRASTGVSEAGTARRAAAAAASLGSGESKSSFAFDPLASRATLSALAASPFAASLGPGKSAAWSLGTNERRIEPPGLSFLSTFKVGKGAEKKSSLAPKGALHRADELEEDVWYSDADLDALLRERFRASPSVHVFPAVPSEQVLEVLAQLPPDELRAATHLMLPVHVLEGHWALLFVDLRNRRILYVDPKYTWEFPVGLYGLFAQFPGYDVVQSGIRYQHDDHSCGPWIVGLASELHRSGGLPAATFTTQAQRRREDADVLRRGAPRPAPLPRGGSDSSSGFDSRAAAASVQSIARPLGYARATVAPSVVVGACTVAGCRCAAFVGGGERVICGRILCGHSAKQHA